MKHLRCLDPAFISSFIVGWCGELRWENILRLRRPIGITPFTAFAVGALLSFRYSIDTRKRTYLPHRRTGSTNPASGPLRPTDWWRTTPRAHTAEPLAGRG